MLNFAIVGCGRIAHTHARQAVTFGKLVAVCDIDEAKATAFAELYHARCYTDINSLLLEEKEVDVVAVCTPNGLHALHSIQSLRAGFHVICEKPMALNVQDGEHMLQAAADSGKHLFIVKQNRFNPPVIAIKKLLDENRLGRMYSMQLNCIWNRDAAYYDSPWKGTRDLDGGILFTQFSHFIDLLYWFAGDISAVAAFAGNYAHEGIINFEDAGVACLKFESGAIATVHFTINAFQKNMEGSLTIIAEKGSVKIGGEYLNTIDYQLVEGGQAITFDRANQANDYGSYKGSMSNHKQFYQHVSEVLGGEAQNEFDGRDGLKTVEIIAKIYKAIG